MGRAATRISKGLPENVFPRTVSHGPVEADGTLVVVPDLEKVLWEIYCLGGGAGAGI